MKDSELGEWTADALQWELSAILSALEKIDPKELDLIWLKEARKTLDNLCFQAASAVLGIE